MLNDSKKIKEEKTVKTIQGDTYTETTVFQNRKLIESKINILKRYESDFINSDKMSDDLIEVVNSKNKNENSESYDEITKQDIKDLNHEKCSQIMEINYEIWGSCLDEVSWIVNEDRYISLDKDLNFQLLNQLIINRNCIKDNEHSETFTHWDLRHLNSCIRVTKGLLKMIKQTKKLFFGKNGRKLLPNGSKNDLTNIELFFNKLNQVKRYQKDGNYYSGNWKVYKKKEDLILDSDFQFTNV